MAKPQFEPGRLKWLLSELAHGDRPRTERAFTEVYRHFRTPVLARLRGMRMDDHTAQDVFHEAMANVLRKAHQFVPPTDASSDVDWAAAWIWRIANNAALDRLRQAKRDPGPFNAAGDRDGGDAATVDGAARGAAAHPTHDGSSANLPVSPEHALLQRQLEDCVQRQLRRFAADHPERADALLQASLMELTIAQLAANLERPSNGATRQFLLEARKKARAYFQPCWELRGGSASAQPLPGKGRKGQDGGTP